MADDSVSKENWKVEDWAKYIIETLNCGGIDWEDYDRYNVTTWINAQGEKKLIEILKELVKNANMS